MKNKNQKSNIEGLLVLVLFGVFAVCILLVLFTGAGAYERLVQREQKTYAERTVPQYITTKVRQADAQGAVSIGMMDGVEVLELREQLQEENYITRIYCYDGWLRELFSAESVSFQPEDGESILEAEQVDFLLQDSCLLVQVTDSDGEKTELVLKLRSAEGGQTNEK